MCHANHYSIKGVSLDLNWIATLVYKHMNTTTPFDPKQIS